MKTILIAILIGLGTGSLMAQPEFDELKEQQSEDSEQKSDSLQQIDFNQIVVVDDDRQGLFHKNSSSLCYLVGNGWRKISLSEALQKGKRACGHCNPLNQNLYNESKSEQPKLTYLGLLANDTTNFGIWLREYSTGRVDGKAYTSSGGYLFMGFLFPVISLGFASIELEPPFERIRDNSEQPLYLNGYVEGYKTSAKNERIGATLAGTVAVTVLYIILIAG